MKFTTTIICLLLVFNCVSISAQTSTENETFTNTVSTISGGKRIAFIGKSHSFSVNVTGKTVTTEQVQGADDNQTYLKVDNTIFQASLVPVPLPLPTGYAIDALTLAQQKEMLSGYADYELNYFDQDLKTKTHEVKKEFFMMGSRLFLLSTFKSDVASRHPDIKTTFPYQTYVSTICFNQVLYLNIPAADKNGMVAAIAKVKIIAGSVQKYNK